MYCLYILFLDTNECLEGNECDVNANCKNLIGTYECTCKPGFIGDGFSCKDGESSSNIFHSKEMDWVG